MSVIVVTDDTTKGDLEITLGLLTQDAKRLSRRGKAWDGDPDWKRLHEIINEVLTDRERARG